MRLTAVSIILLVILTICCGGCVSARDIDTLNFIMALAFDYDPEKGEYTLTVQVPVTSSKQEAQESKWLVYQARGESLFEAIRNLAEQSPRRMFFAHCDIFLMGEEFARSGVVGMLDFLQRDGEPRTGSSHVFVTMGKAAKFLTVKEVREDIPATAIEKINESAQRSNAKTASNTVRDFIKGQITHPSVSLAPLLDVAKPDLKAGEASNKYLVEGMGVFKKEKLIGFLTPVETRGYLWAKGKIKSTALVGTLPDKGVRVTYEIISSKASLKPVLGDNSLTVNIEVKANSHLAETDGYLDVFRQETITGLESALKDLITEEILVTAAKSQELKADIFGIGEKLHRFHPDAWKTLEADWDDYYSRAVFNVQVETSLIRTGRIMDFRTHGR